MDSMNGAPHADVDLPSPRREGREVERIFDTIIEEIISGLITPGTKLNGPDLARRFGCSRGPVREAFRRLEERQLVQCTPNAGARVVLHTPQEVIETYEVREALEGLAARLAARHMTDEERRDLRAAYDAELAGNRPKDFRQDFHMIIVRGSHNDRLKRQVALGNYSNFHMWHMLFPWLQRGGESTRSDHRRILEAIELRDEESAELLMRRHIRRLRLQSIENLREIGLGQTLDENRRQM